MAMEKDFYETYMKKMKPSMTRINRRQFVAGTAAAATFATLAVGEGIAQSTQAGWEEAVKKITGDAKAVDGKVSLDMPEIAENGNTVPFTVTVESPMTEKEYVKAVHIVSTANPQPGVATFRFTPQSGRATVASRMRLARTQDVIALAELSDGKFVQAKRSVKVTIGGCGG
jgi:sulfur-oxidizing protein SoxY